MAWEESRAVIDLEMPAWLELTECAGADPDIFFTPSAKESSETKSYRESAAKAFCGRCLVRDECLEASMNEETQDHAAMTPFGDLELRHGIRGGKTPVERWRLAFPDMTDALEEHRQAIRAQDRRRDLARRAQKLQNRS
jgi:hypothetical protein